MIFIPPEDAIYIYIQSMIKWSTSVHSVDVNMKSREGAIRGGLWRPISVEGKQSTCKRQKIRFSEEIVYSVFDVKKQEAHGPHDSPEKQARAKLLLCNLVDD